MKFNNLLIAFIAWGIFSQTPAFAAEREGIDSLFLLPSLRHATPHTLPRCLAHNPDGGMRSCDFPFETLNNCAPTEAGKTADVYCNLSCMGPTGVENPVIHWHCTCIEICDEPDNGLRSDSGGNCEYRWHCGDATPREL